MGASVDQMPFRSYLRFNGGSAHVHDGVYSDTQARTFLLVVYLVWTAILIFLDSQDNV